MTRFLVVLDVDSTLIEDEVIELIAENPDFEPIIVDTREQQIEIEGIAVGLIRGGEAM